MCGGGAGGLLFEGCTPAVHEYKVQCVTKTCVLSSTCCCCTCSTVMIFCAPINQQQRLKVLKPLSEPGTFCTTLWRPVKGVLFYGPPGTGGCEGVFWGGGGKHATA